MKHYQTDKKQEKIKADEKAYEEGKTDMIIRMHEEGFSVPQIAKVSKKTKEDVAQIIKNHKSR